MVKSKDSPGRLLRFISYALSLLCDCGWLFNLSGPQFPYLYNINSTYHRVVEKLFNTCEKFGMVPDTE